MNWVAAALCGKETIGDVANPGEKRICEVNASVAASANRSISIILSLFVAEGNNKSDLKRKII